MKKILIIALLAASFSACEQDDNGVDNKQLPEETSTRTSPLHESSATPTGPGAHPPGTVSYAPAPNGKVAADISFTPNAGVIKVEPDGQTHLIALQLPGIPGSRQVIWQSLSTGWEGSEFMTMDRENFYVVWGDAVYKVPKTRLDFWTLLVPNNGEDIKGIMGYQTNTTVSRGFYLVRGNCLHAVSHTGTFVALYGCNDATTNAKSMAYYKNSSNGGFNFLFREWSEKTWHFSNPEGVSTWNGLSNIPNTSMMGLTGNPMTNRFYKSRKFGGTLIDEISTAGEGSESGFCAINYTPATSSLVVNNGYVWIMSNTLHQVMTLGSKKGQSAYNEGGWDGNILATADPGLVFN